MGYWTTLASKTFEIIGSLSAIDFLETQTNGDYIRARISYSSTYENGTVYTDYVRKSSSYTSYKADYDSRDLGYGYSEITLYLKGYRLSPPSTPSSISVPTTIKGGENITVSWGSSSGATRYHLERSVNGGSFSQVYSGSDQSYVDSITKGWNTVAYRVRAYNSDGYSSYRTSPTRDVINFPEFNMKVDGALKTSENGWVKIDGALREIDSIWTKVDGILKEV